MKFGFFATLVFSSSVSTITYTHAQDTPSAAPTTMPPTEPSLFDLTQGDLASVVEYGKALETSRLNNTLDERGPFTLFLPNNAAFAELDPRYYQDPQYKEHLENLILLHSKFGTFGQGALTPGTTLVMSNSEEVSVTERATVVPAVKGGEASITRANLPAANGVAHVIDKVLEAHFLSRSVGEYIQLFGESPSFVEAAQESSTTRGVWESLFDAAGDYTVLLPTEGAMLAFERDHPALRNDPVQWKRILQHHIVDRVFLIDADIARQIITPQSGAAYDIIFENGRASFGGEANAVAGSTINTQINQLAKNGIVHLVDQVLISPEVVATSMAPTAGPVAGAADPEQAADTEDSDAEDASSATNDNNEKNNANATSGVVESRWYYQSLFLTAGLLMLLMTNNI